MPETKDNPVTALAAARSFLFVPGDRPERFGKALASGADQVIIDLEDAVGPARKAEARAAIAAWLPTAPRPVVLRINAADSPHFAADLALGEHPAIAGIVLPKAELASALAQVREAAPRAALLPLVESARGLAQAASLAAEPGVVRLMFGSVDFQIDLGIPDEGAPLAAFRSQLVLASRLGGAASPVDGVTPALDDAEALRADVARARAFGFTGKLCIHPRQVEAVNAGFMPSEREIAWARRILSAAVAGVDTAAIAVDGEMVDRPVILKAQSILRRAGETV
ncbi:HpcH/HpaI aldolase/citrate lyase family protein [Roseomonas marmotae]|uniref:CoA ester lyase n=1 Tax=Roseomonas marmotae TaxID=2768161 RepID=A0ABS3KF47_9PROT|nr:CoA ester lyase [Roseomonas marmotae]MBO1074976.1 CoA ester lyase [Roseomonas marmotae]QTI79984.1 CoA ester lyase [Roseomonas marmotae]